MTYQTFRHNRNYGCRITELVLEGHRCVVMENEKVRVTMKIKNRVNQRAVELKTDSKATIKFTGLMGQNFVAIDFGSPDAARAEEGAIIAAVEQPDLSAIMAKLDSAASGIQNLTKSFTPDTINNLMGPLVDFVKQNSAWKAVASQVTSVLAK